MMILRIISFIATSILVCACELQRKDNTQVQSIHPDDLWIEKFSLPFDQPLRADRSSLYFFYRQTFDTSFAICIQNRDSVIKGVYYHLLPVYHRDSEHYLNDSLQLLAFEGFSFTISNDMWRTMINECKTKLLNLTTSGDVEVCYDCPDYILYFDGKKIKSDKYNKQSFKDFYRSLKVTLIDPLIAARKPRLNMTH